ncbi:hypothetical protein PISMIDRAFT_14931 [Pisolithus microcarpus 441]|uniref:Uncharacterized protein n=1 Tax=Pisolithus microcarpus 441 TaxID=765257 RepID=A0A0C9ZCJ3_9AGAM|nr:hypothetical protein PISMIDRAFT_14931 [Pisolithus microcarpus 441]
MSDDDVDEFFAEQEKRMNLPDEDMDAYIRARLQGRHKERNSLGCTGEDSHVDIHSTPPFRIHDHPIAPVDLTDLATNSNPSATPDYRHRR